MANGAVEATAVPILLLVYNRLDTTSRVFERIAAAQPGTLLVVADGPRADRPDDAARCDAVRALVANPGWKCDVRLNFADSNLGFKRRISSGLSWAFAQFEELVILEDDCLPEPTFFPFCAELLERFRHDERVMMISGANFQFGRTRGSASYYFSHGVGTWGWASWRRALEHFDPDMRTWDSCRGTDLLARIWPADDIARYWRDRLDDVHHGRVDTWDYQWAFAMWRRHGLQIVPNVNLIEYIGCLADAAHTHDTQAPFCNVPTEPATFPLTHPSVSERDLNADLFEFYRVFANIDDAEAERRSQEA